MNSRNANLNINIIVAFCKNRGIGLNNKLPWKLNSDMMKFKRLTIGNGKNAVIMGKNTWNSIPRTPLPSRDNLILSNSLSFDYNVLNINSKNEYRCKTFSCVDSIIDHCVTASYETIWIIGGNSVYTNFLNRDLVDKLYVTYLDDEYKCDTFFPEVDFEKYRYVEQTIHGINENNNSLEINKDDRITIYDRVYERINNIDPYTINDPFLL